MTINYDVSIYVDDNAVDYGVFIEAAARLLKDIFIDNMAYLPYTKRRK